MSLSEFGVIVARACNHRNRLASPSRWMSSDCRASSPVTPSHGNCLGIDLGISWENGNRTGFSRRPHSVELSSLAARPDTGFSVLHRLVSARTEGYRQM